MKSVHIPSAAVLAALILIPPAPVRAADDAALARARNCTACHATDRKLIGPAFRDVASRYAGSKDAATLLERKIRQGGSGAWGQVPMPANPQVSPEEARRLAEWILRKP